MCLTLGIFMHVFLGIFTFMFVQRDTFHASRNKFSVRVSVRISVSNLHTWCVVPRLEGFLGVADARVAEDACGLSKETTRLVMEYSAFFSLFVSTMRIG